MREEADSLEPKRRGLAASRIRRISMAFPNNLIAADGEGARRRR